MQWEGTVERGTSNKVSKFTAFSLTSVCTQCAETPDLQKVLADATMEVRARIVLED